MLRCANQSLGTLYSFLSNQAALRHLVNSRSMCLLHSNFTRASRHNFRSSIPATTNGDSPTAGDHADNLQQQFVQLQQQVQGLLNRESSDERVLSESQLTQVQSLVQATINDTIERTATAAAQAAVNAFNGASPPAANVPDRNAPDEDTNSRSVQELLRSSAPDGTSRIDLAIASTSQQRPSDSVHELPAKLVKEILSGEFMELSKLLPQNFNSLQPFYDEPLTLTLRELCHKGK